MFFCCHISNNTIRDCQVNGISIIEESDGLTITSNAISGITFNVALSLKNGIRFNNASAESFVDSNVLTDITGTNSYGIRIDAGDCFVGTNEFRSVDSEFGDFSGTLTDTRIQSYTAGTTVDLNGTDVVEFDPSAGAIIIGTGNTVWSNVITNKTYTFINIDTTNSVTISREPTFCQCDGGVDVVMMPGDTVQFLGGSAVNRVRQLTKLVSNS